ncbi:hypothetical protein ACJX0J_006082 [Zea mays]
MNSIVNPKIIIKDKDARMGIGVLGGIGSIVQHASHQGNTQHHIYEYENTSHVTILYIYTLQHTHGYKLSSVVGDIGLAFFQAILAPIYNVERDCAKLSCRVAKEGLTETSRNDNDCSNTFMYFAGINPFRLCITALAEWKIKAEISYIEYVFVFPNLVTSSIISVLKIKLSQAAGH